MNQKRNILKHTLSMGLATYVAQGLGIITSIAMRRFLGPALMGIWTILQVILGYCGYASFGMTRAMARDYPIARGRGELEKADHLKNLTITFSMIMSVIPAAILLVYTAWRWPALETPFRVGLLFICAFLFAQRFYDLIMTLLRSDKRFDVLSEVTVLNALGMLAIVFIFVWPFKIYGLLIGSAVITLACLAYILWRQPYRFGWYWNKLELFRQLKLAIPLLTISFLAAFYKSMDKLLIAKYLGFAEVGLYSIAMMITSLVFAFPMMLSNVLYPHTLEEYGRKQSPEAIAKHLSQPCLVLSVAAPVLCGLAIFLVPLLVAWFLPKFQAGIPAMKIYLLSIFFMLLAQFSSNVLTTLDKYWINIPILLGSSLLNFLLNLFFIKTGLGLVGVAWGTTVSFVFYGVATFIAASVNFEPFGSAWKRVAGLILINSMIFGAIFILDLWASGWNFIAAQICKAALFLIFSVPFFLFLERKISLLTQVYRSFRRPPGEGQGFQ